MAVPGRPSNSKSVLVAFAGAAVAASCIDGAQASAQSLEIISIADDGTPADGPCYWTSLSDDGNRIVFTSLATNLVAGDTNGRWDVFIRDRAAGTTRRASVSSSGGESNDDSYGPHISADGSIVVFASRASNLVDGDTNGRQDVFVHEIDTGTTTRISVDDAGAEANGDSYSPFSTADGALVFFSSEGDDLVAGDGNRESDVFLRDRIAGTTTRVSLTSGGAEADGGSWVPACSRDGRFVSFGTYAKNFDPIDTDPYIDVYVRDRVAGTTTLATVSTDGEKANSHTFFQVSPVSDDGRLVAFETWGDNLIDGDVNRSPDVFIRDLVAGTTRPAGVDSDENFSTSSGGSARPSMSGDGRFVTFETDSDFFDPEETSSQIVDVYCRDEQALITTAQSRTIHGGEADSHSLQSAISGDGAWIAFKSGASDLLGGTILGDQVYLRGRRLDPAYWRSYGQGYAGTHGVPSLGMTADPVLYRDVGLQIDNSFGTWSVALVLLGDTAVQWPTGFGGDLLVDPLLSILVPLPPSGTTLGGIVPLDESLVGLVLYAQALEIDPGANDGISFTPGVELGFGL